MRADPMDIGSRVGLFVDDHLVDRFEGDAALHLHRPCGKETVLTNDRPWEGRDWAYFSVFLDGGVYRMYYRGHHHGTGEEARGEPMCYAESADGIRWTKPDLGLFTYEGSAENNIVLGGDGGKFPATDKWLGRLGMETGLGWRGDMVPFKDTNPTADAGSRYKALVRGCRGPHQILEGQSDYGMYPFKSPDGLHWSLMSETPVITRGRFDSQNLAFWDAVHGRYVAFVRDYRYGTPDQPLSNAPSEEDHREWVESVGEAKRNTEHVVCSAYGGVRDVRMSTSEDFVHWTDPVWVGYPGDTDRELYTNAILPYERSPRVLIGFPTEMITMFSTDGAEVNPIFMVSRDGGSTFLRWGEPLIPREAPSERDGNRSNYMAHGLVKGNAREYFVYATEGYPGGEGRLRRFAYRVDGFVSVRAGRTGGTVVTPPLRFRGKRLVVNYIAWPSWRGSVHVELQNGEGHALEGLAVADCVGLRGDVIEQEVTWKTGATVAQYAGQTVRLHFALRHADLFSFQFKG